MKLLKSHIATLPFLLLSLTCFANEPLQVVSEEVFIESEQNVGFPVEWPAQLAAKDLQLEVVGWVLADKLLGHCPVLKVLWDGEELNSCSNREENLVMNDGRSFPAFSNERWSLPYGPNRDAIQTATESPYFVPSVGEEIVVLKFLLPELTGDKHSLEIVHSNPGVSQPIVVESITISEVQ